MEHKFQEQLRMELNRGILIQLKRVALSLAAMAALSWVVQVCQVPNPNMILITGLTVFTSLYGLPCGVACGTEMVIYSMYFFSTDHSFFQYTPLNTQKLIVIVIGVVLNVFFIGNLKSRNNEFTRKIVEMNELLQLDNDTLEEASTTDALTGVRNRFALRRDFNRFEGRTVHVMMVDLDDFKHLNDHYGHAVGDFVLRNVGFALAGAFGAESCYRYGGDEFLVIVPDMAEPDFAGRLERFKQELRNSRTEQHRLPVHFSGGYVYGHCEQSRDLRLMLHQADHLLYRSKRRGKDHTTGCAFDRNAALNLHPAGEAHPV